MTKVSFELGSDASDFMSSFRQASGAVTQLDSETKDLKDTSTKVFKSNADEVEKYSNSLKEGAVQTGKMRKEAEGLGKSQNIIKELNKQMKAYIAAAHDAGEGTKEFTENIAKAGKLKDKIGDLQKAVQSLNGSIGENLAKAAGESINLISSGFEGATSASILLGGSTEEFEKTLLKLQAFRGLANMAKEFGGIGDKIEEIKLGLSPLTNLFTSGASAIVSSYGTANESLKGFFSNFAGNAKSALKGSVDFIKGFGSNAASVAKSAAQGFAGFFSNFGANMKSFAASAKAGINTVGTAIKANPLGIILTVIVAVIGAFVLLRDKVKPIAEVFKALGEVVSAVGDAIEEFAQKLGLVASDFEKSLSSQIEGMDKMIEKIGKRYDFEIKLAQAAGKETEGLEKAKTLAQAREVNKQIGNLYALAKIQGSLDEEQRKKLNELFDKRAELINEAQVAAVKQAKELADKEREALKKRNEEQKAANEKAKQQDKEYANAVADLAKKAQAARLAGLSGKELLDAQKQNALEDLELLKKTLLEKKRLAGEGSQLSFQQQKEINALENRIYAEHNNGIIKIESEKAARLAEIETKGVSDALKALEAKAKIQEDGVKAIPKPGNLTKDQEAQFELQKQKEILEIRKKFLQESLNLKTTEVNARANQEIIALQNERAAIENNNDEISKLRVKAIDNDIAKIKEGAETSKDVIVAETKATINEINGELSKIGEQTKPKKLDAKKLLGLDSGELSTALQQFGDKNQIDVKVSPESIDSAKQAVSQLVSSLKELMQAYFDAQNEALDRELKANQDRIDARDENINDLRDKLQEEESLRDQGLANNVDRIKGEIAAQEQAKQEDIKRGKELQEEKKKLAKQQLIIDTAIQASQLVLAIANLFAQGSSFWVGPVPVGLIVAGLAATAMTAAFVVGKKKAFDAVNSGAAQFYTGGYVEGKGGYSGDGGKYEPAGILHGGEYVQNAETTDKHWNLLHGLHTDDDRLMTLGIRDLIRDKGIRLIDDVPEEINTTRNAIRNAELRATVKVDNSKLVERMEAIEGHMKTLVLQGEEVNEILPNGDRIHKKGSVTTIIRAKK